MNPPRYQHDCPNCVYLGQYEESDIYWCPAHEVQEDVFLESLVLTGPHHLRDNLFRHYQWYLIGIYPPVAFARQREALTLAAQRGLVCKVVADTALTGIRLEEDELVE